MRQKIGNLNRVTNAQIMDLADSVRDSFEGNAGRLPPLFVCEVDNPHDHGKPQIIRWTPDGSTTTEMRKKFCQDITRDLGEISRLLIVEKDQSLEVVVIKFLCPKYRKSYEFKYVRTLDVVLTGDVIVSKETRFPEVDSFVGRG